MNPNNYAILVMSEATSVVAAQAAKYSEILLRQTRSQRRVLESAAQRAAAGQDSAAYAIVGKREVGAGVSGSGDEVTEILENLTGQRMMLQRLSYLIRTGEPDGQDLLGAMNFAMMAVNLLAEGKTGRMVIYRQKDNYLDVPIETVTQPDGIVDVARFYDASVYHAKQGILWAARV